jgi:hypothetical protein
MKDETKPPVVQPDKCMYCFGLSFDEWDGTLCEKHEEINCQAEGMDQPDEAPSSPGRWIGMDATITRVDKIEGPAVRLTGIPHRT